MKRTLLCALVVLFSLAIGNQAHAVNCQKFPVKVKSQKASFLGVLLPVKLFVTVTQKPVVTFGNSITSILRQVLVGQSRTKGMPARSTRI